MKFIILLRERFISYLCHSPFVFFVFLIGSVLSALMITFLYGNIMPHKVSEAVNSQRYRTFGVIFYEPQSIAEEDLTLLENFSTRDIFVEYQTEKDILNINPYEPIRVQAYLKNNNEILFYRLFEDEQLYGNNLIASLAVKDESVTIEGITYEVVKRIDYRADNLVFVPIQAFLNNHLESSSIEYILKDIPSHDVILEIKHMLIDHFGNVEITAPDTYMAADSYAARDSYIQLGLLYIISLIVFLFLFKYIMEETSHENIIYKMVGVRNSRLAFIVVLEMEILAALSSLCAIMIHIVLYKPLFSKVNAYENIKYNFMDYVYIFVFVLVLSLAVTLPFVFSYIKRNLVRQKNKYG